MEGNGWISVRHTPVTICSEPSHLNGSTWDALDTQLDKLYCKLRILASYEAKTAKICTFWIFWPVIQRINYVFKI